MANKSTTSERETAASEASATVAAAPALTLHKIVKYGDPVLEKPAATIQKFDAELERLAEEMFATMYAAN
ncbi:MAG TPA: peptide deformylase, partial [Candidatus Acidoferrum sp.]